jgi:hypothetical protein
VNIELTTICSAVLDVADRPARLAIVRRDGFARGAYLRTAHVAVEVRAYLRMATGLQSAPLVLGSVSLGDQR